MSKLSNLSKKTPKKTVSMHASFDKRTNMNIMDQSNHLPEIKKLHLDNILKNSIPTTRNAKDKTFLSNMKFGGSVSQNSTARVSS